MVPGKMSTDSRSLSAVLIGAGNVASHLAARLHDKLHILQIYSRHIDNARHLADSFREPVVVIDDLGAVYPDADIYIVAVKDDAISAVSQALPKINHGVVVHTSGSAPDDALASPGRHYGVLYPLQTFTRNKPVDWEPITIFTHSGDEESAIIVDSVAAMLNHRVRRLDGNMRARLHVAAVFACNFANYMWIKTDEILRGCGTDISVLRPLLEETLHKALATSPADAQTGPARRGDTHIIDKHAAMLPACDAELYRIVSNAIMNHFSTNS